MYGIFTYIYHINQPNVGIYDPGSRFATTPPPPHGMVPKPAFCSIPHENVVFAVFFEWWVAGAVCKPANSQDFCSQASENVLFAMFSASTSWSSAVAPPSISMSNYHKILNLLLKVYSLGNWPDICLYLIPVKLSLRVSSFPYLI